MKSLYLLILSWLVISCSTTHYCYIVRHADKLDKTPNSVLSPEGHARSEILKNNLQNKKIDLIFATPFQRTQETAQPLATFLNKPLLIYRNNAEDSMATVIKSQKDKNILLVGHSGNIPRIIEKATGKKIRPIGEEEYDNLYIIRLGRRKVKLTATKY
jgi:broad specificity phosphatase PhoE